jgi:hypothetical protein
VDGWSGCAQSHNFPAHHLLVQRVVLRHRCGSQESDAECTERYFSAAVHSVFLNLLLFLTFVRGLAGVKDTYDESGRRVRKARVKAENKIAEHAEWVTNNPYRMPLPGQRDDNDAAADDEDATEPSSALFNGGSAAPSTSGAVGLSTVTADDDDEGVMLSDGVHLYLPLFPSLFDAQVILGQGQGEEA